MRDSPHLPTNPLAVLPAVQHRDTERDGFPSELHGAVDAVSLDLPHPWRVIESADACLVSHTA